MADPWPEAHARDLALIDLQAVLGMREDRTSRPK